MRDGAAALEYLSRHADRGERLPVLVLLDLRLPRMSGLEVLRAIRRDRRTRAVPVVVLTTSSDERDLEHSYALGADSFIRKPVDFPQFAKSIADLGFYGSSSWRLRPGRRAARRNRATRRPRRACGPARAGAPATAARLEC